MRTGLRAETLAAYVDGEATAAGDGGDRGCARRVGSGARARGRRAGRDPRVTRASAARARIDRPRASDRRGSRSAWLPALRLSHRAGGGARRRRWIRRRPGCRRGPVPVAPIRAPVPGGPRGGGRASRQGRGTPHAGGTALGGGSGLSGAGGRGGAAAGTRLVRRGWGRCSRMSTWDRGRSDISMIWAIDTMRDSLVLPRLQRAGANPPSLPVSGGVARVLLPDVVHHDLAPGPLEVRALFTRQPLTVTDVEAWVAAQGGALCRDPSSRLAPINKRSRARSNRWERRDESLVLQTPSLRALAGRDGPRAADGLAGGTRGARRRRARARRDARALRDRHRQQPRRDSRHGQPALR